MVGEFVQVLEALLSGDVRFPFLRVLKPWEFL